MTTDVASGRPARCTRGVRHWFTYYNWVGSSAPTCRHCGAPNPNYDASRDPKAAPRAGQPE